MEITSDLFASVRVARGLGAELQVDVFSTETDADGELLCDVQVDDLGHEAAVSLDDSLVGMEFDIDGVTLTLADLVQDLEVSRSLDSTIQSARFSVPLDTPDGPIGNPFSHVGPATCKREISVFGLYATSTGLKRIPIITKGEGLSSKRRGGKGGFVETFEVLDRGGRYDQALVSLAVPAGSGLPRERVLEIMASEAGVVDFNLEPCGPTNKEFVLSNARWLEPCSDALMDVELRKVNWNRGGELSNPRFGAPSLHGNVEPVKHHFSEKDFHLETDVEIAWSADQITRVKLTGSAPLLRETCAVEIVPKSNIRRAIYAPRIPGFAQNGDGSFDALDPAVAGAAAIMVGLDIIEKQTKCGTVIFERALHYAYYNPEAGRYEWDDATDQWKPLGNVFTDDDSGGEEIAMQFGQERFVLFGAEETWHYWLQFGYRYHDRPKPFGIVGGELSVELSKLHEPAVSGLDYSVGVSGYISGEAAGIKLGTISRVWGFYAPRAYVQTRSVAFYPYAPWDETEPPDGRVVLGNKEGYSQNPALSGPYVALGYPAQTNPQDGETFTIQSIVVETLENNSQNYLTGIDKTLFSWQVRSGVQFRFGDGKETAEEEESFGISGTGREDYLPAGDSNHDRIVRIYDRDGRELPSQSELGADGFLPAAEFIDGSEANPALYADDEEQEELSSLAHRTESQDLEVEIIAEDLESCREVNEYIGSYEAAETDDELERASRAMIAESCAADITGTLLGANFYVSEGDLFGFRYFPLAGSPEYICRVESVRWSRSSPTSPLLTSIAGKYYGW